MLKLRHFLLLLGLFLSASPAAAWWEYGHETVAAIALKEVRPETRREIARMLAHARELDTPTCAARTIEQASVWPDCVRALKERFNYSFPWHYQNVNVCQPFDLKAACKDGNCVSAQIERNALLLADTSLPARERLTALAFLVHFVGDLHMPLHAGDKGDLGGNRFGVDYGLISGRTNIHTIWDGYLAERAISTPPSQVAGLLSEVAPVDREAMKAGTVEDWSKEGWEVSRLYAYGTVLTDPCMAAPAARPVINEATTRTLIPVVRTQVVKGGLRLARLLDEALG
jgi:hypothetical protein